MKIDDIRKLPQIAMNSKDGISILGLWMKANEDNDNVMIKKTMKVMLENSKNRKTSIDPRIERININKKKKEDNK